MTVEALAAWLLSVMLATVPPGGRRSAAHARESVEQGKARYAAIARSLAAVSLDPKEPPLFQGAQGRAKTAALMLALSLHESHWRRDVDLGLGRYAPSAGRRYHCLMQVGVSYQGKTAEGWTAAELVEHRERCFRSGLHILQRGQRLCRAVGPRSFVNHYASGYCDHARRPAQKRWRTFEAIVRDHPPPRPEAERSDEQEAPVEGKKRAPASPR